MASIFFFWQLTRDTSFLSGILGVEYQRLLSPSKGQARADGGPTWTTVYEDFKTRLAGQSYVAKHTAVGQLLHTVVQVERGKINAASILEPARQVEATDSDNWISRLALAALLDASMTGKSPQERLEAIRPVIEAQPPPTKATLYNQEYDQLWSETLGRYFKRPDVRANLAKWLDHGEIKDHYAALPIIQRHLNDLRIALDGNKSADQIRTWLRTSFLSLIYQDSDSGTRLLSSDIASRCFDQDSRAHQRLRALSYQFKADATAARPDLTSQTRTRAVSPREYRKMMDALIAACCIASVGFGAAMSATVFGILCLFFVRTDHKSDSSTAPRSNIGTRRAWPSLYVPAGILTIAVLFQISLHGPFSENWGVIVIVMAVCAGAMAPLIECSRRLGWRDNRDQVRLILLLGLVGAPIITPLISSATLSWWAQPLGGSLPLFLLLSAGSAVAIAVAFVIGKADSRQVARMALKSAVLTLWLAVAILLLHNYWDRQYLAAVSRERADEVAARLGPEWNRYLREAEETTKVGNP